MAMLSDGTSGVVNQLVRRCFEWGESRQWRAVRGQRTWHSFQESLLSDDARAAITIRDGHQYLIEPVTISRTYADLSRSQSGLFQNIASQMERATIQSEVEWAAYWDGNLWC